jgi:ABC-2 type transport system ATP-binding protein
VQTICEKILIIAKGKLIAYDEPEKLENQLMAPNEIIFTTEAGADETREILGIVDPELVSDISVEEKEDGYTGVHLKTAHDNIYDVSRAIFFAFAEKQKALLEMSLKKANLEDIFIELTTAETPEEAEPEENEPAAEIEQPAEEIEQSEEGEQS